MLKVEYMNGGNEDYVGAIPLFLNENNPRSAKEQIDDNYQHGGGWDNFNAEGSGHAKFELLENNNLHYPETDDEGQDPDYVPRAKMQLRDETIYIYDYAWVVIMQPDRSFEVARID